MDRRDDLKVLHCSLWNKLKGITLKTQPLEDVLKNLWNLIPLFRLFFTSWKAGLPSHINSDISCEEWQPTATSKYTDVLPDLRLTTERKRGRGCDRKLLKLVHWE